MKNYEFYKNQNDLPSNFIIDGLLAHFEWLQVDMIGFNNKKSSWFLKNLYENITISIFATKNCSSTVCAAKPYAIITRFWRSHIN